MEQPIVNLKALSMEQLQALCAHFFRGQEVMWRCHGGLLRKAAEMELSPEILGLFNEYSQLMNDTLGVTLTGIQQILDNDIGAPPAGGIQ